MTTCRPFVYSFTKQSQIVGGKKCQSRFLLFAASLGSLTQSTLSLLTALPPLRGPDALGPCPGPADSRPGGRGPLPEALSAASSLAQACTHGGLSCSKIQQNPQLLRDRYRVCPSFPLTQCPSPI